MLLTDSPVICPDMDGGLADFEKGVPGKGRGIVTAGQDKRNRTCRLLSDTVKVHTMSRKEKQQYCSGPESVLIDDREKAIRERQALGGTGILHTDAESTLERLKAPGLL